MFIKKIIFILILLVCNSALAQTSILDFHYDTNQTRLNGQKIDLKTIQKIEPKKQFKIEEFNKENKFNLFLGVQRDEFERESGFFVQELNPSVHLNWIQLFSNYMGIEVEGGLSKNALIPKSNLLIGTGFHRDLNVFLVGQVGSKLALVRQVTSGYFFYNYGLGIIYQLSDYKIDFRYLIAPTSLDKEMGFELRALKKLSNKSEAGFYISQENYYPQKLEYSRQGQDTFKVGLLYSF
jgi:hypothetical protein